MGAWNLTEYVVRRRALGLKVKGSSWHEVLESVDKTSGIYFFQDDTSGPRDENLVERFLNKSDSWHDPWLLDGAFRENYNLKSIDEKAETLESIVRTIQRQSSPDRKRRNIVTVIDELLLNALISAPRAAAEIRAQVIGGASCVLAAEWTDEQMWIHMQDPWGAFLRGNFAKSFRPASSHISTHGHSGRGMQIILDACTDLFIASEPGELTWVAVRFDLTLSNVEHEKVPKRLLLDMP
jgi:hypothetical protein